MLVSQAWAQSAGGGGPDLIVQFAPLVLIVIIFYFLLIRPRQKQLKEHQKLVGNLRRGDVVVTSGGLVGKISKILDDAEVQVELAEGVRVKVVRQMIQEVRSKSEPVIDK